MRATWGTPAALAAMLLCLMLGACGGGDDEGGGSARTGTTPGASGSGSGLGPERFAALDAVYVAQVPIDEVGDDAEPSALKNASAPLVEACEELDADDPLLGPLRRACPVLARFAEQLAGLRTCGSRGADACDTLVGDMRGTLRDFTRLSRRGDEAIRAAKLTRDCASALLAPAVAYEAIEGFERAFELLQAGEDDADRVLAAADAKAEQLPEGDEALARFRSGCR